MTQKPLAKRALFEMITRTCEIDDVSAMPGHISMATSSEIGFFKQEILQRCLTRSVWNNLLKVLT